MRDSTLALLSSPISGADDSRSHEENIMGNSRFERWLSDVRSGADLQQVKGPHGSEYTDPRTSEAWAAWCDATEDERKSKREHGICLALFVSFGDTYGEKRLRGLLRDATAALGGAA